MYLNFEKFQQRKSIFTTFLFLLTASIIFSTVLLFIEKAPRLFDASEYEIADPNNDYIYDIEVNSILGDELSVSGWIVSRKDEIFTSKINVVLKDGAGSFYMLPTEVQAREDIPQNPITTEHPYHACGFISKVSLNRVLGKKPFNLYLLANFNQNEKLLNLGTAAGDGK